MLNHKVVLQSCVVFTLTGLIWIIFSCQIALIRFLTNSWQLYDLVLYLTYPYTTREVQLFVRYQKQRLNYELLPSFSMNRFLVLNHENPSAVLCFISSFVKTNNIQDFKVILSSFSAPSVTLSLSTAPPCNTCAL